MRASNAVLDWQLEKLFFGELYIGTLHLTQLRVDSRPQPAADDSTPFELPDRLPLPVIIRLADAQLRDFEFRSGESSPFVVNRATLRGQCGSSEVIVNTLNLSGPEFELAVSGSTLLWQNYKTAANVDWRCLARPVAFAQQINRCRSRARQNSVMP